MDNQQDTKPKKPWYKKWWVWVIAVFVIAGIGNALNPDKDNANTPTGQTQQNEKSETATSTPTEIPTEISLNETPSPSPEIAEDNPYIKLSEEKPEDYLILLKIIGHCYLTSVLDEEIYNGMIARGLSDMVDGVLNHYYDNDSLMPEFEESFISFFARGNHDVTDYPDVSEALSLSFDVGWTPKGWTITPKGTPQAKTYKNGTYLVGNDIESGLYKVILTDNIMKIGYVERSKGVSMEFGDILANIIITGDGYVEIKDTDVAVKLQGVEISPISLNSLEKNLKNEVSDGIYLVGYDIAAGTYKVEVTDEITGIGYVERARSVSMGLDDIIANELIQGQGYVEIKNADFAVKVQGAKLILQ